MGIMKPYVTRVGTGIFPSEDESAFTEALCEIGHEYGSVTGRRRRVGIMDLPMLKYAIDINGVSEIFITKLDVAIEASDRNHGHYLYVSGYTDPDGTLRDYFSIDKPINNVSKSLIVQPTYDSIIGLINSFTDGLVAGFTSDQSGEITNIRKWKRDI